ncbi:MAG TPA: Xaa-Pro peptidase family protein [Polyangia bacterium]|nr:Xaa-Pro peptidase family protein [Polyangia bacterium]
MNMSRAMRWARVLGVMGLLLALGGARAQEARAETGSSPAPAPPAGSPYALRRQRLLERFADGIVLLHARSTPKAEDQPSFVQDATFFYFTGLGHQAGAILALDGPRKEARLFVPPPPEAFGFRVEGVDVAPGAESARALGLSRVEPWDALVPYLRARRSEGVTRFYIDEARRSEAIGAPATLAPVAGDKTLWRRAIVEALPGARVESAAPAIREMRWVKSPEEITALRRTAQITAMALRAGLRSLRPGVRQRRAEAAVITACIEAGGDRPSFWPWTMSGPNAHVPALVRSVYDERQLDRTMQAGELVRVDIGCGLDGYGADVGRTAPVSGHFEAGQRETWNLLIAAYRAGLAAIRPGATIAQVMAAAREALVRRGQVTTGGQDQLVTAQAREAVRSLTAPKGMGTWTLHGVGIDSGEAPLDTLAAGAVIAFEPTFSAGTDAFYLEDMILVTASGYEVLSAGLPYTAEEIEAAMAGR